MGAICGNHPPTHENPVGVPVGPYVGVHTLGDGFTVVTVDVAVDVFVTGPT